MSTLSFSVPKRGSFDTPCFVLGTPAAPVWEIAKAFESADIGFAQSVDAANLKNDPLGGEFVEATLAELSCDEAGLAKIPSMVLDEMPELKVRCRGALDSANYPQGSWLYADTRLTLLWSVLHRCFPTAAWIVLREPLERSVAACLNHPELRAFSDDPLFWRIRCSEYAERLQTLCDLEPRAQVIWRDQPEHETESALTRIRHCETAMPLTFEGSVALVGNSDQIMNQQLGDLIDSFDQVIRFNLAPAGGKFREQVGERTTLRLLSRQITSQQPDAARQLENDYPLLCYVGHARRLGKQAETTYNLEFSLPDTNRVFSQILGDSFKPFTHRDTPRNGIVLIALLLEAGFTPHLFGFDHEERDHNSHYYDDEKQFDRDFGHKPSMEYALLSQLSALGKVVIH